MSETIGQASGTAPTSWWRRFGRRNWAYLAFVVLLVPFGIALEASGPGGPDRGGGVAAALMLGGIGTALYGAFRVVRGIRFGSPTMRVGGVLSLAAPTADILRFCLDIRVHRIQEG